MRSLASVLEIHRTHAALLPRYAKQSCRLPPRESQPSDVAPKSPGSQRSRIPPGEFFASAHPPRAPSPDERRTRSPALVRAKMLRVAARQSLPKPVPSPSPHPSSSPKAYRTPPTCVWSKKLTAFRATFFDQTSASVRWREKASSDPLPVCYGRDHGHHRHHSLHLVGR
jgi:hypothetical protein